MPSGSTPAYIKWNGCRALAGRRADGRVAACHRNGSDLSGAFDEIAEPVRQLPHDTAVDCELVVWEECPTGRRRIDSGGVPVGVDLSGRSGATGTAILRRPGPTPRPATGRRVALLRCARPPHRSHRPGHRSAPSACR